MLRIQVEQCDSSNGYQNIDSDEIVSSWGSFNQDKMNLSIAGELQADAVKLMQRLGYK